MEIKDNETKIPNSGTEQVSYDQNERITWLVQNYLIKLASDGVNWTLLYQDPNDNRYWELHYPHSDLHGGGPAALRVISKLDAKQKYNV